MTTIDKLDIGVYIQYAQRTQWVEQIKSEFRLEEAESIPPQAMVVDFQPKPSEMDMLLGVIKVSTPWALFVTPMRFREQRRSPFTVARIVPSLGSQDDQEETEEELEQYEPETAEEEREKAILLGCFKQITKLNDWLGHVIGRIGQFLQA